jgi:MFS family permease
MTVTRIFDDTDDADSPDFDYVAIFVSSAAELIGTAYTISLIDRIGRVKTLVGAFILAGISLFSLCILTETGMAPRGVLIIFALLSRAAEMSTACVVWIVTVELLSTEILSTGHSAVNAIARAGAFFSPYLVVESNPLWVVGLVLLVVNIVSAVTASTLIETKGIELGKAVKKTKELNSQELVSQYQQMDSKGVHA